MRKGMRMIKSTQTNVRKYTIVKKQSVSLRTDPPLVNHNLAIFSVHSGTEKLNKSPQADKKP